MTYCWVGHWSFINDVLQLSFVPVCQKRFSVSLLKNIILLIIHAQILSISKLLRKIYVPWHLNILRNNGLLIVLPEIIAHYLIQGVWNRYIMVLTKCHLVVCNNCYYIWGLLIATDDSKLIIVNFNILDSWSHKFVLLSNFKQNFVCVYHLNDNHIRHQIGSQHSSSWGWCQT